MKKGEKIKYVETESNEFIPTYDGAELIVDTVGKKIIYAVDELNGYVHMLKIIDIGKTWLPILEESNFKKSELQPSMGFIGSHNLPIDLDYDEYER